MEAGAPTTPEEDAAVLRRMRVGWFDGPAPRYWLTRFVYLRGLGFIHTVAFAVLLDQMGALIGSEGLLPASNFLSRIGRSTDFVQWPTLFWLDASDPMLHGCAWIGMGLAIALMLGVDNGLLMLGLWAIYLSFCHVGQVFWGYGWEILLLEATFLGAFLCPVRTLRPMPAAHVPPPPVIWMIRWLVFRVMFGAGMIKIRGDACWTELTCLAFHYETQPIPHPLSWLLHQAPMWFHKAGALFNHFVELVVPWFVFGPRRLRHFAGAFLVAFQLLLILSGNLSFLNWLTLVVCLSCFDDGWLRHLLPQFLSTVADGREGRWRASRAQRVVLSGLGLLVGFLSLDPVANMLSPRQAMNTSFEPLHLVNSYGAFGSVGATRHEVVLQGTLSEHPDDKATWYDYEFPCKPGNVERRPCLVTPYHYRLDWQMWFAALGDYSQQPWILNLSYKLLRADPGALSLLAYDPFHGQRPRFVRAELYRYRFTRLHEDTDAWWQRERIGTYLTPLSLERESFMKAVRDHGWR